MDKHLVLTSINFEDSEGKTIKFDLPFKVLLPYIGDEDTSESSLAFYSGYIIGNLAKNFPEISVEAKKEEQV